MAVSYVTDTAGANIDTYVFSDTYNKSKKYGTPKGWPPQKKSKKRGTQYLDVNKKNGTPSSKKTFLNSMKYMNPKNKYYILTRQTKNKSQPDDTRVGAEGHDGNMRARGFVWGDT